MKKFIIINGKVAHIVERKTKAEARRYATDKCEASKGIIVHEVDSVEDFTQESALEAFDRGYTAGNDAGVQRTLASIKKY